MAEPDFDFRKEAQALLKRLQPKGGAAPQPALALAAVEAALREAYARGAKQGVPRGAPRAVPASAPGRAPARPAEPAPVRECPHEWEEAFLDGRELGARCVHCGLLQKEVQDRCDHYFVRTDAGEICVACRRPRRALR